MMSDQHRVLPPYQSIFERIHTWLEARPDRVMFTFVGERGEEVEQVTLRELDASARRIASWLRHEHGLAAGDRVLLAHTPSLDFVRALLATLYAGLIPAPVPLPNPFDPESGMALFTAIAEDCGARAILTNTEYARARKLGSAKQLMTLRGRTRWPQLPWIDTARAPRRMARSIDPPTHAAPDQVAVLQYTSGSTSLPKGVMITHGNLWHQLGANALELGVDHDSRAVLWVPHYHDFGLISGILSAIYSGAQSWLMSPLTFIRNPAIWFDTLSRVRGTHIAAPNFAYDFAVKKTTPAQRARWDLSALRVVMSAAEPILPRTVAQFLDAFAPSKLSPEAFCPAYGLAEHTVGVSVNGRARLLARRDLLEHHHTLAILTDAHDLSEREVRELVGCGPPSAQVEVRIVDPTTGAAQKEGQVGEIWVDSPSKAAGYWGREEESARTFRATLPGERGAFLRTGDLGLMWGGELFVTGRLKELLILNGRNIYPQDIEETVRLCHRAVRPGGIAAFSLTEQDHERLVLWVEVTEGAPLAVVAQTCREAVLRAHQLMPHLIVLGKPGLVLKTTSGKIRRGACRASQLAEDAHLQAHALERLHPLSPEAAPFTPATLDEVSEVLHAERDALHADGEELLQSLSEASWAEAPEEDERELEAIAQLVARVLDQERVDVDAPLAALGLSSLAMIEVSAALEERGYQAPMAQLGRARSLRELLQMLRSAPATQLSLAPQRDTHGRASLTQQLIWNDVQRAPSAHTTSFSIDLTGPLSPEKTRRAITELLNRHPILRANFSPNPEDQKSLIYDIIERDRVDVPLRLIDACAWDAARLQQEMRHRVRLPFDFASELPLRFDLYQHAPEHHTLHVIAQHLVYDMVALMLLVQEVLELLMLHHAPFTPLHRVPAGEDFFNDFVAEERALLRSDRGEAMRQRWREALGEADLSPGYPGTAPKSHHVLEGLPVALPGELCAQLAARAAEHHVTPYAWLLAMWQLALATQCASRDFLVSTTLSLRLRPERRDTIGPLTNYMAIRADLRQPLATALDHVHATHARLRAAMADGELPFPEQLAHLAPISELGFGLGSCINYYEPDTFGAGQLMHTLRRGDAITLGPLTARNSAQARDLAPERLYDTVLAIIHWEGRFDISLRYHPQRLDAAQAEALCTSFVALLTRSVHHPQSPLDL